MTSMTSPCILNQSPSKGQFKKKLNAATSIVYESIQAGIILDLMLPSWYKVNKMVTSAALCNTPTVTHSLLTSTTKFTTPVTDVIAEYHPNKRSNSIVGVLFAFPS